MRRIITIVAILLGLTPSLGHAESFTVGPEGDPPVLFKYVMCLALCPAVEPLAWLQGQSLLKDNFLPDRIHIDTDPSGAEVQIFFRRGSSYGSYAALKRYRGTTPITLKATPAFGFGENSYFSVTFSKRGYKSLVKEIKVTGSEDLVFKLDAMGANQDSLVPEPALPDRTRRN